MEVLFAMEGDSLCLDFALLHIHFVAGKDDRNVLADPNEVTCKALVWGYIFQTNVECVLTMPVRDVLVSDTRSNVEHDDSALAVDVVPISQASEFLLPCRVPDIKHDVT